MRLEVHDDPAAAVADLLTSVSGHVVLTGGTSPKRAYALAARGDWSGKTLWFSDERCVPPDHEWSNYRMAEEALLSKLDPRPEVLRMQDADTYDALVRDRLGDAPPWDLLLLGLGPDAHCASLFPGKPEVDVSDRLVVGVPEPGMEPQVPRISLTLPAINAARHVVFLVTGESKRDAVQRAFGDDPDPASPAAHVRPTSGELTVYLDPAAAP